MQKVIARLLVTPGHCSHGAEDRLVCLMQQGNVAVLKDVTRKTCVVAHSVPMVARHTQIVKFDLVLDSRWCITNGSCRMASTDWLLQKVRTKRKKGMHKHMDKKKDEDEQQDRAKDEKKWCVQL